MLIEVKFQRPNTWSVDENVAQLIPEIRATLIKDGPEAVAVIAYLCDPLSPVLEAFEGNPIRMKTEAVRCIYKSKVNPDEFYAQKHIKDAIDAYNEWCDTKVARMINIQKAAVIKAYDRLKQITEAGNVDDIDGLIKSLEKMPTLIKSYINANTSMKEEVQNIKNNVKGEKILTRAEKTIREQQLSKKK